MKGIVLAGGSAPICIRLPKVSVSKCCRFLTSRWCYYPISTLMLAGIWDILIISTPTDFSGFKQLLGDGSDFGVKFTYAEQPSPDGLAQAFIIGKEFIGSNVACLVLGDTYFTEQASLMCSQKLWLPPKIMQKLQCSATG